MTGFQALEKIKRIKRNFQLVAFLALTSGQIIEREWNQKEGWCENLSLISNQVSSGKYRLKSFIRSVGKLEWEETIYSNEFTIKEKDETANWKTYKSEKYGFEIRYPEDWIISKNILGAFDIYKNFEKYQCSIEIYANKDKYLYPLEESNKYFQGFSESQISIKPEEALIGNISATKISSPDLSGREIFFFKKKIENREYYFNIFLDVTDLRYKYDVIVKNHDCKEIFNRIIATFNFPENIFAKDLFDEPICKYRKAQFEMRIYDIQGRITGVLDGKIKEEIPGSYCTQDKESNETIIDLPPDTVISKLEIFGITDGNYEFSINGSNPEEPYDYVGVKAKDIPIVSRVLHHFEFDWKSLSKGKEGVAIMIDTNNDHIFEKTIVSDSDLSCEEFIIQLKER
jgi:hypothetical protein